MFSLQTNIHAFYLYRPPFRLRQHKYCPRYLLPSDKKKMSQMNRVLRSSLRATPNDLLNWTQPGLVLWKSFITLTSIYNVYPIISCKNMVYRGLEHKGRTYRSKARRFSLISSGIEYQGPVVQSVISLTISLRVISLIVLADPIYNILIFFVEKMWVAFHFFSAKNFSIFAYHSM